MVKILKELLLPDIQELIKEKDWRSIKQTLSMWPGPDIADLLESLKEEDMVVLFRLLNREKAAEVFRELNSGRQKTLLQQMSNEHIKNVISELSPDDRTELFEELPGKITQKLLNLLSPEIRKETLKMLGYPEESVGRLMTPDYVAIRPHWTVKKALEYTRRHGRDAETIDTVYVVDDKFRLIDDIPLRKLILAPPQQKIESIMDRKYIAVSAFEDQEKTVKIIQRYNLFALPVVDSENVLLGIVTVDDILDVLEDEVTEDIQKGASIVPLKTNYTTASIWTLYKKRVGWLSLLLIAGFISTTIIAAFEETIATIMALAFFIPVLIDSGGNTGSQSATLVIRAIATGDLTLKKWVNVIKKEVLIGVLLGLTLGILLYLWGSFWRGGSEVGLIVGMSMFIVVIWANLVGGLLPIVLTKLKLDPAVISSPLITTLVDSTGLLIYFWIAKWWLRF